MSSFTFFHGKESVLYLAFFLLFTNGLSAQISGARDTSFHTGTGFSHSVKALGVMPNGNIFVGGDFNTYNGQSKAGMVVLQPNGTPDATFAVNATLNVGAAVRSGFVEPNGKILIGGFFSTVNGVAQNKLARLKSNGHLDSAFIVGTGPNNEVTHIHSNGQNIAISGFFSQYNGTARGGFAYLDGNGTINAGFTNPTWTGLIHTQYVLPNGKVLVGGNFASFQNAPFNRIALLNTDGSVDTSFNPGSGASGGVEAIAVQADGKILIGGAFTSVNGQTANRVARLHQNGSIDTTFDALLGASSTVRALAITASGKIVVGGQFPTFNGNAVNYIVQLNSDGSVDSNFQTGTGLNGSTQVLVLQPDNKILVGGSFTQFQGFSTPRLVRLTGDSAVAAPVVPIFSQMQYTTACYGDTVVLEIIGGNISANDHWQWRIGDCMTTLYDTVTTVKFTPQADTTTFAIKSSGGANCATIQLFVMDTVPPQLTTTLPIISGYCQIVISPQNAPRASDFCEGQIAGIPQGPLTYSIPGNYTLPWLFDDCHGNTVVYSQQIEVLAIDTSVIYPGATVPWELQAVHASQTAKYEWVECSFGQYIQLSSADTLQSYIANHWGEYAVIISEGTCSDTSACKIAELFDVAEFAANDLLKLYPNPATTEVLLHCDATFGLGELTILNLNGQLLYSEAIGLGKYHKVSIESFPQGVYLVQVHTAEIIMTQRLVKL